MGRWQNRVKQALYRPSKSGAIVSAAIEAAVRLLKEPDKDAAKRGTVKK